MRHTNDTTSRDELISKAKEQLRRHALVKALRTLQRGNMSYDVVASDFEEAIKWCYCHKSYGVILSAYYEYGICTEYSVNHLMHCMYNANDFPSFLKQAYRFDVIHGFLEEIEIAIRWHERRRMPDAAAWRYKFDKLKEQSTLQTAIEDPTCKEVEVFEEIEDKEITDSIPILKLRAIERSDVRSIQIDDTDTTNDPYIVSRVSKSKMQRANSIHKSTVSALINFLLQKNYSPIENRLIDTFCELNSGPALFEIKSITEINERDQVREAVSQLLEYRYLYSLSDASMWIVFSVRPFSQWLIEYLLNDRDIRVLWRNGDIFEGPSIHLI